MHAPVRDRDEVLGRILEHRDELRLLGAGELSLFGSFARGDQNDQSDVDLLLVPARSIGYFELFDMKQRLEEILVRNVDLLPQGALKPSLREHVLAEAIRAA